MADSLIDWDTLARLRTRFLEQSSGTGVYWQDENDLENYHAFFGARIGWKWDNVLEEAAQRGFRPQARRILDWGCGSGIATLRAIEAWGTDLIDEVVLWDHSALACRFAKKKIQEAYPNLNVEIAASSEAGEGLHNTIVLVSHALNELTLETQNVLSRQLSTAAQVIFVEAGNHATSRLLTRQREALREYFHIVAPCTQCEECPMLENENARHWCHFFGKPPIDAFTDGDWARFAILMEIDLRSLPYSCLVLNRKGLENPASMPDTASRLIGRARQFKGYTRLLSCDTKGLRDLELQKRDDKALWKSLKKGKDGSLYEWSEVEEDRIKKGGAI